MVAAADQLKSKLNAAGGAAVSVSLTGASGMWSDFNTANRNAMLKSELFSWPVTMAILVLAFGSLVAAGLPLLLTILGLVASAGLLALLTHGFEISIWAMNFALMFALALGIDYALFVVHRFRGAFFGSKLAARDAVAVTMDTAGKAVLFSGLDRADLALGGDARAEPGLPLDGARDHAQRRLRARRDADAAAGRAGEARPEGRRARAPLGALRRAPLRPLRALGRAALAPPPPLRARGDPDPRAARASDRRAEDRRCRRSRSSRPTTARGSATPRCSRRSASARPARCRSSRRSAKRPPLVAGARRDPGIARVSPPQPGRNGLALIQAIPNADPSSTAVGRTIDRLRSALPAQALVGGAAAENHDLERALGAKTPLVIGDRARARLPAPARRAAGAADRRARRRHEPARHRRRLRRRAADLPERPRRRPARLRVAGLPRRLGARSSSSR